MKYYKMINDNEIIGAISSNNFIYFSPVAKCFLRSTEQQGEYISYNGLLYRDTWMRPIRIQETYTTIQAIEITETEYNAFVKALEINETIPEEEEEDEPEIEIPVEEPDDSLEFIRTAKLKEMSHECHMTIENGFDLELRGETHHFSLDTQDQLNLISLSAMAQTQSLIPYHADGEACIFYTAEEINEIVSTATAFKIYHTTYYNALKTYINSLQSIEEIDEITYGTEIPEEYKSDVLKALEA